MASPIGRNADNGRPLRSHAAPPATEIAIAILTAVLAPRARRREGDALVAAIPWLPDWNDPLVWRLGFILASVNRCISAPIPSCRVSWPTPAIPI